MLETELEKSLKVVSERTMEGSSVMSKQFEIEVAGDLEKVFADFKCKAAKTTGNLKIFLLESTKSARRKIVNCVAILSNPLTGVLEDSSVKPSASVLNTSAAAAGTPPSTSAVPNSKEIPPQLYIFH